MARVSGYITWNKIRFPQLCGSMRGSGEQFDSPLFFRMQSAKGEGIEPVRHQAWGQSVNSPVMGCIGLQRKSWMFGKQRMDRVTHDLSDANFSLLSCGEKV